MLQFSAPRTGGLSSRHEKKYVISESKAVAIAQFIRSHMRPDKYCQSQPDGSYMIATLYLDTQNLALCQHSMTGQKNRFKLRVRSYSDEPDSPCFFEIKRRADAAVIKTRSKIVPDEMAHLLSEDFHWSRLGHDVNESLKQFLFYMSSICAKPMIRVRYRRQAFESIMDDRVRITFDRELAYQVTRNANVDLNGGGWRALPTRNVVLEVKFTGRFPAWVGRMTRHFDLRVQSVSKYVHSIRTSSSLGLLLN